MWHSMTYKNKLTCHSVRLWDDSRAPTIYYQWLKLTSVSNHLFLYAINSKTGNESCNSCNM